MVSISAISIISTWCQCKNVILWQLKPNYLRVAAVSPIPFCPQTWSNCPFDAYSCIHCSYSACAEVRSWWHQSKAYWESRDTPKASWSILWYNRTNFNSDKSRGQEHKARGQSREEEQGSNSRGSSGEVWNSTWDCESQAFRSFLIPQVSEVPPPICGSRHGTGKVVQCGMKLVGRMILHQVSPSERVRGDSVPRQRHQVRQVPVTGGVSGSGSWDLSLPAVCSADPELAVGMAKG